MRVSCHEDLIQVGDDAVVIPRDAVDIRCGRGSSGGVDGELVVIAAERVGRRVRDDGRCTTQCHVGRVEDAADRVRRVGGIRQRSRVEDTERFTDCRGKRHR